MGKKILLALLVIFVLIQFIRIDKTNPATNPSEDFFAGANIDTETETLIKAACYDCHSNESTYPWYSDIAPVSFWVKGHIDEGREHLNFSTWSQYSVEKQNHKLEESVEETEHRHMPILPYTWTHPEAKLTDAQVTKLVDYFKSRIQK